MLHVRASLPAAIWMLLSVTSGAGAQQPAGHTVTVQGHPVRVWEKSGEEAQKAILLVHGRTWSSLPDFDLQAPRENLSFMDALVASGFRVYAVERFHHARRHLRGSRGRLCSRLPRVGSREGRLKGHRGVPAAIGCGDPRSVAPRAWRA